MICTGTLINIFGILLGGSTGLVGRSRIDTKYQESLLHAAGISIMFIGISGTLSKMLVINNNQIATQGSLVLIISVSIGSFIGQILDIEEYSIRAAEWLKIKSGNMSDPEFVNAFITASFTVVFGAMGILGAMQEGMLGNYDTLITKAIIDFIMILALTAAMGKGCLFAAIPVGIWQSSLTLASKAISPFITTLSLDYIGMVGSVLIFCIGVNLITPKFRVANMIPSILIAWCAGLISF